MSSITYRQASALIAVPFAQPFVDAIKKLIPHGYRTYQEYDKTWTVYLPYVTEARRITLLYFPETEERNKHVFDGAADEQTRREAEAEERRQRFEQEQHYSRYEERSYDPFGHQRGGSSGYGSNAQDASGATKTDKTYETLGVTPNAPQEVVQAAWKALSRKHHPDITKDNGEKQRQLNDAYDEIKKRKGWT